MPQSGVVLFLDVCVQKPLDNDHIAPLAIQSAMLLISADLTKAERSNQPAAGCIVDEDARDQFPESGLFARGDERFHDQLPSASASRIARNVDRDLGNSAV